MRSLAALTSARCARSLVLACARSLRSLALLAAPACYIRVLTGSNWLCGAACGAPAKSPAVSVAVSAPVSAPVPSAVSVAGSAPVPSAVHAAPPPAALGKPACARSLPASAPAPSSLCSRAPLTSTRRPHRQVLPTAQRRTRVAQRPAAKPDQQRQPQAPEGGRALDLRHPATQRRPVIPRMARLRLKPKLLGPPRNKGSQRKRRHDWLPRPKLLGSPRNKGSQRKRRHDWLPRPKLLGSPRLLGPLRLLVSTKLPLPNPPNPLPAIPRQQLNPLLLKRGL